MKSCLLFLMIALIGIGYEGLGQSIQVIPLEASDSVRAAELFGRMLQAQKDWAAFQADIRDKYASASKPSSGATATCALGSKDGIRYYAAGFCGAFQFSANFRYILP